MHDQVLAKLEFPAILDHLARLCRFSVAGEKARELGPSGDEQDVAYLLDVTSEAVDLLTEFPDVTIGGARDVRVLAQRAAKGARLQPAELLQVLDLVSASRNLRRAFLRLPMVESRFPRLLEFVDHLAELPDLEADINRSIGPRGDVLDTASAELSRIRRDVRVAHSRLMERLNALVSGGKYASVLQDSIITTRDGRYVVPVRSDARAQLQGVVHDTSASGQTLFVEPFEIVELNNRWRERQLDEQHEIDRILDALSDKTGSRADEICSAVEAVAAIDLAMAKARLSFEMRAHRPALWHGNSTNPGGHPEHRLSLRRARHPLLDPAEVVPIDVDLGEDFRVLLITGPNTGGKTVALKTIGLLTLMAQTGLFIPADDTSVVSVFPAVFIDIGDEQSIAQSLSTFSGHIRTVIAMLRHVTPDDLVLLDELGAGTDPQEGSALARAIVSRLLELGPLVVATTHYPEVKAYAFATPGVENASVEFDVTTLAPTYRLMIGVPGRSNALAIAGRLGMPSEILDAASGMLDPDELRVDNLLQDIRRRRDDADASRERARAEEEQARALRGAAERELEQAERARREARSEALTEAERELEDARETLKRLRRDRDSLQITREHLEERRREVDHAAERVRTFRREKINTAAPMPRKKPIASGDRVRVVSLDQEGEVVAVDDGMADVMLGALKTRQPLGALERIGRVRDEEARQPIVMPASSGPVNLELDLRGYRAAEIEALLDEYLEHAYRAGMPFVRIIHGKGTGALRKVVKDVLSAHPVVASHEIAPANQGGDGATVALLRGS
ncbi:MAG: endonuclease MutS2 [Chloroflexi bacterium]|nr:endonuclease MutS2 [Chloroflexota bacterium]